MKDGREYYRRHFLKALIRGDFGRVVRLSQADHEGRPVAMLHVQDRFGAFLASWPDDGSMNATLFAIQGRWPVS